jgi:hypothetical protein
MGEQGEIFSFTVSEAGTLSSFNSRLSSKLIVKRPNMVTHCPMFFSRASGIITYGGPERDSSRCYCDHRHDHTNDNFWAPTNPESRCQLHHGAKGEAAHTLCAKEGR